MRNHLLLALLELVSTLKLHAVGTRGVDPLHALHQRLRVHCVDPPCSAVGTREGVALHGIEDDNHPSGARVDWISLVPHASVEQANVARLDGILYRFLRAPVPHRHPSSREGIVRVKPKDHRPMHAAAVDVSGQLILPRLRPVSRNKRLKSCKGANRALAMVSCVPVGEDTIAFVKDRGACSTERKVGHGGWLHFLLDIHVTTIGPLHSAIVNNLLRLEVFLDDGKQ
mmetsp:Transcript_55015/g.112417  ORF Transcript_55015/g.112417 Transcript_55015/m.112417 type:complete len:227 (+) Transcript_55015:561-1241(+)